MAQTDCGRCRGTGWASAARDSGTENAHRMHVQIGVYSCPSCGGSGKIGLSPEQEKALAHALLTMDISEAQERSAEKSDNP